MSTNINEAAQNYILEGSAVVKKYSKILTEVNHQLERSSRAPLNMETQTALAKLLNNTQDRINYELRESTQNTMVGPYKRYAMDIIAGLIPNLIATDIVSLQPLENKQGVINYVQFTAGSDKGGVKKGDLISNTFNYGDIESDYTGSHVASTMDKSAVDVSNGAIKLEWSPILPGSVAITVGGTTYVDVPVSRNPIGAEAGTMKVKDGADVASSSINYQTGVVTLGSSILTGTADVDVEYIFNNQYAPVNVPELDLQIVGKLLTARSRKLKALWSFDAQYELQKDYGQDIGALLAAQAAGEIAREIDAEICNDLVIGAGSSGITWDAQTPYGVAQAQHFESLKTAFNQGSRKIYQATKRAVGNFVVCGTNVATVIESTPSFVPAGMGNVVGPYMMGTWGAYKVYVNPFMDANKFVVGFKGNNLFEAGYVYAPYLPIATTQMLMLADFSGQQGWATQYATDMLNNKFYCAGSIVNFG